MICLLRHIAAAVNALPALLDAAAFLDEVRARVARGALCPMCSTGMTRQTVGMVCQLCGTDYGSPEYSDLRRDSEHASKAVLSDALTVRAERDALAAKVEAMRAVHARYFDMDGRPGYDDTNPEPEDVWRFDRDFRAALDATETDHV